MKAFAAFFRLIRWPNLLFIVLTQVLFRYCVIPFIFLSGHPGYESSLLVPSLFIQLVLASVCIAGAGYIINDYFDVNIDLVNKSSKVIIGKYIKRRAAILWHALLSLAGLALSLYVGYELRNPLIPLLNFISILLLWVYSSTFKKKLLIGNVIISLLTAWVILVLAVAEYRFRISAHDIVWQRMLKLSFVYAGFAFIISMVREVIKDMEDLNGDLKYGSTTMPITWGIPVSKVFSGLLIVVLAGLLVAIQIYVIQFGWWYSTLYCLVTIIIPLVWILKKLYIAVHPSDYRQLSTAVKWVMLAGILSMVFFYTI